MYRLHVYCLILFLTFCDNSFCFSFHPIASIKKYTWCQIYECCNDDYIPARFDMLKLLLNQKLYGQHLAEEVVVNALAAHFADKNPQKALTLSFHGWPGSGKNYVTKFIKDSLYIKGSKSKFVHQFTARVHFPVKENVRKYQNELHSWLKGNISNCERSLFIFDEVDKMPENVLNAIKPMIDYNDIVDNVDYRKAVFIFLSNTGGTIIKDHLLHLWQKGVKRNEIQLKDFENIISKGAFNEEGGFHRSDTIKHSLIDHYIPFFPMEKFHVELCIKDVFSSKGIYHISDHHVKEVMETVEWGPEPINMFSTTGCKRLSQKVPLVIRRYGLRASNEEL